MYIVLRMRVLRVVAVPLEHYYPPHDSHHDDSRHETGRRSCSYYRRYPRAAAVTGPEGAMDMALKNSTTGKNME